MITYRRICIKDFLVGDLNIERGKEYLTSETKDGWVTLFSKYWVDVPVSIFAGELRFT